jgi:hypothetical protein
MQLQREYQNVIFTNHALERLSLRELTQAMIVSAVTQPDEKRIEDDGDTRFIKSFAGRRVHVVAKFDADDGKWVVKTVWVRGEDDEDNVLAPGAGTARRAAPSASEKAQAGAQLGAVLNLAVGVVRMVISVVRFIARALNNSSKNTRR